MIQATLTGSGMSPYALPPIEQDFINIPTENAADVVTLSGEMYTDFTSQESAWEFNYASLTEEQYENIRAIYDSQFTEYAYPTLSIPFFSLEDKPVRMYINSKNIWNNCGDVQNVQIQFRETAQLPESS